VEASGCGVTADAPQNRIPMASSAIGISHFTCRGRDTRDGAGGAGEGRGGEVNLWDATAFARDAPGRRP
jgi:hypothetical protein